MSDGLTVAVEASLRLEAEYTDEELEEALDYLGADEVEVIFEHTETQFREQLLQELDQEELESLSVSVEEVTDDE